MWDGARLLSTRFPAAGPRRLQSARTAPPRGRSPEPPPGATRAPQGSTRSLNRVKTWTSGPRPERAPPSRHSQRNGRPLPEGGPCPRSGRLPRGSQARPGSRGGHGVGSRPHRKSARARWLPGARVRRGGAGPLAGCPRPRPPAFRGRRDNRSGSNRGGRTSPAPPPGRSARQAAAPGLAALPASRPAGRDRPALRRE